MKVTLLFLLLFSASAQGAIFGTDDRVPLLPTSPLKELGRATAVAVLSANIEPDEATPGTYKIDAGTLDGYLCPNERFSKDQSLSYSCSGFLVAPDLMVTAGHCMSNTGEVKDEPEMYCAAYGWLFDYQQDANGQIQARGIPADKYYKCKKIVFAVKDEAAPFRDFALVQLDRPVVGRTPLKIADPAVKVSGSLQMIGYPMGTPMKLSPNARVLFDEPTRQSFVTNLDAFEGNSGSAVLNQRGEAVGILVGGTPALSTFRREGEQCERYNRCDDEGQNCVVPDKDTGAFPGFQGTGSEVQRIAPVLELLKQAK